MSLLLKYALLLCCIASVSSSSSSSDWFRRNSIGIKQTPLQKVPTKEATVLLTPPPPQQIIVVEPLVEKVMNDSIEDEEVIDLDEQGKNATIAKSEIAPKSVPKTKAKSESKATKKPGFWTRRKDIVIKVATKEVSKVPDRVKVPNIDVNKPKQEEQPLVTKPQQAMEKGVKIKQPVSNSTQTSNKNSTQHDTDKTIIDNTQKQQQSQSQQQPQQSSTGNMPQPPGGIIVLGGKPYRTTGPPRSSNPNMPVGRPYSTGLFAGELFGGVLSTVTRIFLLTWLTRRLAMQQEVRAPQQHFVWESLNDRYARDAQALKHCLQTPPVGIAVNLWKRKHVRPQRRLLNRRNKRIIKPDLQQMYNRTAVVIEVVSDNKGNVDVSYLTDFVTFIIQQHSNHAFGTNRATDNPRPLEVIFCINSPGGSVATYGLAAAQIRRLKNVLVANANATTIASNNMITTTACVDRYAASGGYMMACQADRIVAAPFATVGSIGVIIEGLNFNQAAQKLGVQSLIVKSADAKNPLSTFGQVSERDLEIERQRIDKVHDAFVQLVQRGRPTMQNVRDIANGDIYLGAEALQLQLVDQVMTSSEYIMERIQSGDRVLQIHKPSMHRTAMRRTSPVDILPHLLTWYRRGVAYISGESYDHVADNGNAENTAIDSERLILRILQVGTLYNFGKYLLRQHYSNNT